MTTPRDLMRPSLTVTPESLDHLLAHIIGKLQLETRAELVMFALANGVIGPDAN